MTRRISYQQALQYLSNDSVELRTAWGVIARRYSDLPDGVRQHLINALIDAQKACRQREEEAITENKGAFRALFRRTHDEF